MTSKALFLLVTTCLLIVSSTTHAEYRVALLIGNDEYKTGKLEDAPNLDIIKKDLEQRGFKCKVMRNLRTEYAFRDAIGKFANSTPTRSTAVLYFFGKLGENTTLLSTDARKGFSLDRTFQSLSTLGGSWQNIVFIESPDTSEFNGKIPGNCQLVLDDFKSVQQKLDAEIAGQSSQAISPPKRFTTGKRAGDEWVNERGIVFCWCPPGRYVAGSPPSLEGRYPDEEQREVEIKDGFWLSKYELAFGQTLAKRRPGRQTIATRKLDPMTMINHDDAKSMTRNFTSSERKAGRLPDTWQYSLPTEEQWEYAARADTKSPYYFGNDVKQLPLHANFADKSYYDSGDIFSNSAHRTLDDGAVKLSIVGSYKANPWGFHDIYGNVAEWCIGLEIRGGSWASVPQNCRSAYRDSFSSRKEQNFIGYRIVIQKNPPVKTDK